MSDAGAEMRRPHQPRKEGCGHPKNAWSLRGNAPKVRLKSGTHYLIRTRGSPPPRKEQLAGHRYRMVIEDLTKDEFRLFLNFFRDMRDNRRDAITTGNVRISTGIRTMWRIAPFFAAGIVGIA
ncbi:hypothetical protein IB265_08680 [Ensifer sp. ENS10]|uniref:hypothetical protein n=1 Tax=unclassified Ensifer TaxID=2633371 RepID=UPI0013B027E3|nr:MULTISPECIES: hypothetical protein [unclassified Ensifer]MBD9506856.1 hypothetical protein [Ensifer sp. ENS10]MBV7517087.1 hypothetical protein [Ensifer sp. ENS12]